MPYKTLQSKEIYRNRWLWITEDEVETDHGVRSTFTVLRKKPFALIIPWDGRSLTLVSQFRYQINSQSIEFPQGHFEHDSLEVTAVRELKEETGLTAEKVEKIGSFYPASGAIDQECHVFLATSLTQGSQELESTEGDLKTLKLTIGEMKQYIKEGKIKDGPTLSAYSLFITMKGDQ